MNKLILVPLILSMSFTAQAIEKDKKLHLGVSTVIGGVGNIYFEGEHGYWKSVAACSSIGFGKELYDEYSYGGFDAEDLAWDVAGCLIGSGYIELLESGSNKVNLYAAPIDGGMYFGIRGRFGQ